MLQSSLALSFAPILLSLLAADGGGGPEWVPTFGGLPGTDDSVYSVAVFDDGSGPSLFVGGGFSSAGSQSANGVARWDGAQWHSVGGGVQGRVNALCSFDDGGGAALYAGGQVSSAGGVPASRVARWDGTAWSALGLGVNSTVEALCQFDSPSGPLLIVGGSFNQAGGQPANRIASFDGTSWSALGSGLNGTVTAVAQFDDGQGMALFVGGNFTTAGGQPASCVARWDGHSWQALGQGVDYQVLSFAVYDDGSGPGLIAGGFFTQAGGQPANGVAKWDGQSWSPLGSGVGGPWYMFVTAMTVVEDVHGERLIVGGEFLTAGGSPAARLASWDGQQWSPLGAGVSSRVTALTVAPTEAGESAAVYAGGWFGQAGDLGVGHVVRWDGNQYRALGTGLHQSGVFDIANFDDGNGMALYVGGIFRSAGDVVLARIGRWDGTAWSPLGTGVSGGNSVWVDALASHDDGSGEALYAGGLFQTAGGVTVNNVARWDGQAWSALGAGVAGPVLALTEFDDGTGLALYAGGAFATAGGQPAMNVAKWDGQTWSAVGNGTSSSVRALRVFDEGQGPRLFAAGGFSSWTSAGAPFVARYDGGVWGATGTMYGPHGSSVAELEIFDDGQGGGPALYAAGDFDSAGGVDVGGLVRWNGNTWSAIPGAGVNGPVRAIAAHDDGDGAALFVSGSVGFAGFARWDGTSWSSSGAFFTNIIIVLRSLDDGGAESLFVGGGFPNGSVGDSMIARRVPAPVALFPVPGCSVAPAALTTPANAIRAGSTLNLSLSAGQLGSGFGVFYVGLIGTDALGCGLVLPGIGELLLGPVPSPLHVASTPLLAGTAALVVPVPPNPSLLGVAIALQGFAAGIPGGVVVVEASNALSGTIR